MFEDGGYGVGGAGGGAPGTVAPAGVLSAFWSGEDESASLAAARAWLEHVDWLVREQARLHAEVLREIRVGEECGFTTGLGHASMATLLADRLRLTKAQSDDVVRQSRVLTQCPDTMAALEAGDVNADQANAIAKGIAAARRSGAGPEAAERILLDLARVADARAVRGAVKHLRHAMDPDREGRKHSARETGHVCHLGQTIDGVWHLDAVLGPEGGAIVQTALDALMADTVKAQGDADNGEKAERISAPQARADALIQMATMVLQGGDGADLERSGGQRPHLSITAPIDTLLGYGGEMARTQWGGLLPQNAVQRHACDSETTIVLVDRDGTPLDVGRSRRFVTPKQRRALEVRDKGCTYPGCGRPVGWCEAHHKTPWARGGRSDLGNYTLYCRRHHVHVHQHGEPPG